MPPANDDYRKRLAERKRLLARASQKQQREKAFSSPPKEKTVNKSTYTGPVTPNSLIGMGLDYFGNRVLAPAIQKAQGDIAEIPNIGRSKEGSVFGALAIGNLLAGGPKKAAEEAPKGAQYALKGFDSNIWRFDPERIREAAAASTELGKRVASESAKRIYIPEYPVQYTYDAEQLARKGIPDLRDLIYLQQYGSFDNLIRPDDLVSNLYRFISPQDLKATFMTPAASVAKTLKTLTAKDRLVKRLTEASPQEALEGIEASKSYDIVRSTIEKAGGLLPAPSSTPQTIRENLATFTRLSRSMNPEVIIPRLIQSPRRGHGLEGEHSSLPVGNIEEGLKALAGTGDFRGFDEIPALVKAVQTRGLDISKLLNRGFGSLPRTIGDEISREAPAFKSVRELTPELFRRFEEAGGIGFYGEDLQKQLEAAPTLVPRLLEILNQQRVIDALTNREKSRGNFSYGVRSQI